MTSKFNCDVPSVLQAHLYSIATQDMITKLNLDASAVSRIKNNERGLKIDEIAVLLKTPSKQYPNGLTIAAGGVMSISKDEFKALRSLAKKYLEVEEIL